MLKAIVSYSKKIPVPDSEYSSQGYSLSLETEMSETEAAATQRGQSLSDLNAEVKKRFGVDGLYDLSRREASALLDELKTGQRRAA